jgi:8-oxo-dGTP diphosphatase
MAFCESCGRFVCIACLAEVSSKEYDSAYLVGICKGCDPLQERRTRMVRCPRCGATIGRYRSPLPTVDIIIRCQTPKGEGGLVLILRDREPRMWALPGGFCEYGESLEDAAVREAREETGLAVELLSQFHTYSDPRRDPRHHSITTVFTAKSTGEPVAGDDAKEVGVFPETSLPDALAFDHKGIIDDYLLYEKTGTRPQSRIQGPFEQR